jgi:hypothetical protein
LVEAEMEEDDVVVFAGFTLGWVTRGACEFTAFLPGNDVACSLDFDCVPYEHHLMSGDTPITCACP